MKSPPRISVVIVTYNFAAYLHECIDSILAQTLRPYEIVVYDDCSTDDSWRIISEFSQEFPELFVVHRQPKNVGMHTNINAALQRARGDLISWLDGDDRWLPRKLELEWAAICLKPEAEIAYSNVNIINAAGHRTASWYDGKGPTPPSGDVFVQVFSKRFFSGTRSVFRNPLLYRSIVEEMDYHDENVELYIDWDLKLRLTARCQVAYSGETLVEYRVHTGGIHNQPRETHLRDLVTIYHKNLPLLAERSAAERALIASELDSLARGYGGGPLAQASASRSKSIAAPQAGEITESSHCNPGQSDSHRCAGVACSDSRPTNSRRGENLIFLVSLPRSGSTLLQRVLANHPDVHTTAEPWVMLHPLYALKRQGFAAEYGSDLARQALGEFLAAMPDGEAVYIDALRAMASVLYGKALESSGKRLFLDKTPRYYYILPELARVFPRARFVLLLRNPAAVLSSMLRTWLGDDLQVLRKHPHHVDLTQGPDLLVQGMRVLGDAAITIHYEDLVGNPADTVRRICDHVGIPFRSAMLEYGQMPAPSGTFGDPRSVDKHSTVVGDYVETWHSHLADVRFRDFALEYIDTLGETTLERLGYSSDITKRLLLGQQLANFSTRTAQSQPGSPSGSARPANQSSPTAEFTQERDADITQHRNQDANSLNKEGEQAFNDGEMALAEARFKQAYALAPNNIEVLNNLVVFHWHRQDVVNALNMLARALVVEPLNRNIIVNGGQILVALSRHHDASTLYSSYLEQNPNDTEVSHLFASLNAAEKKPQSEIGLPASLSDHQSGENKLELLAKSQEISRFRPSEQILADKASRLTIADQGALSRRSPTEDEQGEMSPGDDEFLVTAIVSTYNSEQYIEGCLQDLMSQSLADRLEVIVVDSGSQQNERAVVESYQARYTNIRYLQTEQRETIYAAWNRAVSAARGKYLTNANTDDRHLSDAYQRMVAELEMNPDVSLVYADCAVTRLPNATFDQAPVEGFLRWPDFDARHLFSVCYIGPQPMWRRSVHQKYGYFDPEMRVAGDYDFWLRLATCEDFKHIPEVLGLYLLSSDSIEHAFAGVGAQESEIARERNWPAEWGQRPALSAGYLVSAEQPSEDGEGRSAQLPLVSVIMPTRDRLKLLGRALDSVIAQTYRNWELIVVNDGGESVRAVIGGRDSSDRIRLIECDRSHGQAVARNTALTVAKGEIICYLDDDDIYFPHHLDTMVRELCERDQSFVYTDAVVVKERLLDGTWHENGRSNPYVHHEYSRQRLLVNNYIPINTWGHKRACLDEIGLFDRSLSCYEDWEFLLRLSERYDFHHVEQTTVEVRHRVDQVDNVSRRRLADTADAYRQIYAWHKAGLTDDLRLQREAMLQSVVKNIESHLSHPEGGRVPGEQPGPEAVPARADAQDSYREWLIRQALSERDVARMTKHMMTDWTLHPSVHLVMTHLSGQEAALADTLDTLASQLYGGWGLSVISHSTCPDPMFEEMGMLEWRQIDGDLMQEVNVVVGESVADWIGLVHAGCRLEPHLLFRHVDSLHQHPEWRLVYMDEDRIGDDGERYDPLFKPEFNLELLRTMPYMGLFLLLQREALAAVGGYARDPETAVYDIVFRFVEQFGAQAIGHIPEVLIHQQDRFQLTRDEQAVDERRRQCVAAHLQRCGRVADVRPGSVFGSYFVDYVCYEKPPVEIIVLVGSRQESLALFLNSLSSKTDYPDFRVRLLVPDDLVLGVDACSDQIDAVSRFSDAESQWQKLLEMVCESDSEQVLLMSPGSIAIQPAWLERLVAQLQNSDVAVVAPRLISAQKRVVGGGIILGAGPWSIGSVAFSGLALDEPGYMGRAQVAQEMSAVSASCMLVRRSMFESLGGLSDVLSIPLIQAVDYCLRVREAGGKIVWTPHSTLLYLGEEQPALDGVDIEAAVRRESEAVGARALAALADDPGYNPNLKLVGKPFSVDGSLSPHPSYRGDRLGRVVGFGAGSIGSWKFRVQQPLQVMHREGVANTQVLPFSKELVRLPSMAELERVQADSLLMHNAMHDPYMDAMEAYKRLNRTFIVFGQDDLMYAMPPKNPFSKTMYKDIKKRVRRCLAIADRLVVTTQALAEELRNMADDIQVVPNYLDETVWGGLQSQRGVSARPRVGWAGAQQHLGDLELLEEVVRETAQQVDWVFFGMCPHFLQPYVKEIHNPVTFEKYPQKLATLNLDLAVAPLEHNRFNECKSNLRILEYGALGWPVVASDISPYREGPFCRVHNQPRAWIKAIRERIHDLDASRQEGDLLRRWVRENWLLQQHLADWLAVLDPASDAHNRLGAEGRAAGL